MTERESSDGLVVLVGAGPGDEQLATAAAARWISHADVIVYDRLAATGLLRLARTDAERIYVGKNPGEAGADQESINELLIRHARAGRLVVRLKGGDPFIFGRGGEEAEALADAGIGFRVVPGITAGAAAAACAGIPLTDRRYASSVAFVTGHEADPAGRINWEALAGIDTVVIYMGVGNLDRVVSRLIQAGRDGGTPAAIVASASRPRQRVVAARLDKLAVASAAAGITPPAVAIVGKVAALAEKLAWFERLPLFGRTVIVTRPQGQAGQLSRRLVELGAAAIEAPAIVIGPPEDLAAVDAALRRLGEFDWIVFTSVNGVDAFVQRCRQLGLDGRSLGSARLAAVGPATGERLRRNFIAPDLVPETFTTEALAEAIRAAGELSGRRLLLARTDIAGAGLPEALRSAGADVEDVAFYRTGRPDSLPQEAAAALRDGRVDWVTFASPSAVDNFAALLGPEATDLLAGAKLAAIGPVTAEAVRARGLTPTAVARTHTIDGLVEAIVQAEA